MGGQSAARNEVVLHGSSAILAEEVLCLRRGGIVPVFNGIAPGEIVVVERAILLDDQIDMAR